jgi:putative oxidoreductase
MIRQWYRQFVRACEAVAPVFLLCVRLYWGWQFVQTGSGKIGNLQKVTGFFDSLHIPFPYANAVFVSWLELVGGILLALGLGSRVVAFLLAGDMAVAYLTAGRDNLLNIFSHPDKFYGDDAFTFLFASLIVLFFGPGWISIDRLIQKRYDRV